LKSINLESNRLSPDTLAGLFEALAAGHSRVVEVRVTNQAQNNMGSDHYNITMIIIIIIYNMGSDHYNITMIIAPFWLTTFVR
jgi:hypothetical protein